MGEGGREVGSQGRREVLLPKVLASFLMPQPDAEGNDDGVRVNEPETSLYPNTLVLSMPGTASKWQTEPGDMHVACIPDTL